MVTIHQPQLSQKLATKLPPLLDTPRHSGHASVKSLFRLFQILVKFQLCFLHVCVGCLCQVCVDFLWGHSRSLLSLCQVFFTFLSHQNFCQEIAKSPSNVNQIALKCLSYLKLSPCVSVNLHQCDQSVRGIAHARAERLATRTISLSVHHPDLTLANSFQDVADDCG